MRRCFFQTDSTSPLPRSMVELLCMGMIGKQPDEAPQAYRRAAKDALAAHGVPAGHGLHHS